MAKVHLTSDCELEYGEIKHALRRMGVRVFENRPQYVELSAKLGSLELTKQVVVDADPYVESTQPPACFVPFRLRAAEGEGWYPVFDGALVLVPQPHGATVALQGSYRPPIGLAGQLADSAALHNLAEQSLMNLLLRAVGHLRHAVSGVRDLIGHPYS